MSTSNDSSPATSSVPTSHRWSSQQELALRDVSRWLRSGGSQVFYLAGFAGTGKTTLAKYLAESEKLNGPAYFTAYTGKAASVLRKMGCPGASTLHSVLYSVSQQSKEKLTNLELEWAALMAEEDYDPEEVDDLRIQIAELRDKLRQPVFTLQEDSVLQDAGLVVVDECSMINKPLAADLESFGKKILVMGDPAQLPPVEGGGYYTKRDPDIMLTEIHRQAAHSPIIRWATMVREGQELPYGKEEGDATSCHRYHKAGMAPKDFRGESQLLAGKNVTRRKMNKIVRKNLGHEGAYPKKGERLVVLQNDRDWGVLNGVTCEAAEDALDTGDEALVLDLLYEDRLISAMPTNRKWFDAYASDEEPKRDWDDRWMVPMDYGYCLTVHKAQGSQWDHVTICDDGFAHWDKKLRRQWLYTAITRAQNHLTVIG